jgi:zinc transport system substrate-binding protein
MVKPFMLLLPLLVLQWLSSFTAAAAPLQVVVSSKPFHSLVAGVMRGIATPELLITGNQSPHNYSLRPRDAMRLQRAQLIFWGGAGIEPLLERPLQTLPGRATTIALNEIAQLTLLPSRGSDQDWGLQSHDSHEDDHADEAAERQDERPDDHLHGATDPHFWLDPINAKAVVEAAIEALASLSPSHRQQFQRNGERLLQQLDQLHQQLQRETRTVAQVPFMLYHDSFQYFERRYQLHAVGVVVQHLSHGSSAGKLQQVQQSVRTHRVRCIFKEPQFSSRLVQIAAEGSDARIGILDPIGANLIPGESLYFQLMEGISRNLRHCLGQ